MAWWILIPSFAAVTILSCYLFESRAGLRKRRWYVVGPTIFGWVITFSCVFMVPDDVISTEIVNSGYTCDNTTSTPAPAAPGPSAKAWLRGSFLDTDTDGCSPPLPIVPYDVMVVLWVIMYWSSFFGCWIVYPLLISYVDMADFHISERLSGAIKENIVFYFILGVISGIAAIVLSVKNQLTLYDLMGVSIALSNSTGLLLLVMLLGFGLIAIPRKLWRKANTSLMLKRYHYKSITMKNAMDDASHELDSVLKLVRSASEQIQSNHPYRKYIDKIIKVCVPYGYDRFRVGEGQAEVATYDQVVNLRYKVKAAIRRKVLTEVLYDKHMLKTFDLEDVAACQNGKHPKEYLKDLKKKDKDGAAARKKRSSKYLHVNNKSVQEVLSVEMTDFSRAAADAELNSYEDSSRYSPDISLKEWAQGLSDPRKWKYIPWSMRAPRTGYFAPLLNSLEFYWHVHLRTKFYTLLTIVCALLSLVMVWSEATFWTVNIKGGPDLSIFSILLDINSQNIVAQLLIFTPLSYMALCAFYSLFKLRIFNLYRVKRHQQTDDRSLLFSAAWLARLIPPLSFNFLLIVHKYQGTAFAKVMKSMDVMGRKSMEWFNFVMTVCLILLCASTFFNLYGKILELLRIKSFQFEDGFHDDQIDEGAEHIRRARKQYINDMKEGKRKASVAFTTSQSDVSKPAEERPDFKRKHQRNGEPPRESVEDLLREDPSSLPSFSRGRTTEETARRRSNSFTRDETPPGFVDSLFGSLPSITSMFGPRNNRGSDDSPGGRATASSSSSSSSSSSRSSAFEKPSYVSTSVGDPPGSVNRTFVFADDDDDMHTPLPDHDSSVWEIEEVSVEI